LLFLAQPDPARAGMPAPLPTDPERVLRLNESALVRLQTISFFLVGLLLCAAAVMGLWNYLRRNFPRLPRSSMLLRRGIGFYLRVRRPAAGG
jgi:hypothetical protein